MRGLSLLVVLLALTALACGGDDAATCRAGGGVWECKDAALTEDCRCAAKTADGGHPCTDPGMCEGACIHTTGGCGLELDNEDHAVGTCQTFLTRYTCYEELLLEKPDPESPLVVNCQSNC